MGKHQCGILIHSFGDVSFEKVAMNVIRDKKDNQAEVGVDL